MQRASRLKRELHMLATEPPPGITCWQDKDQMDDLRARTHLNLLRSDFSLQFIIQTLILLEGFVWMFSNCHQKVLGDHPSTSQLC
ncbi:ubiquitin-conjugating enzyme E2T (putative), isoform CRA_d [Homo sapiens]|uniref:Ubiquitin conjugating enzyme E2 T n=1 Tax=Homo sapiens TaxID=9606 RepID=A0A8V8TPM9_HUMAN|nr:ubiquitin-conjugating enzyme E2T (putative), isoform CRA_d [Homo sapiens]